MTGIWFVKGRTLYAPTQHATPLSLCSVSTRGVAGTRHRNSEEKRVLRLRLPRHDRRQGIHMGWWELESEARKLGRWRHLLCLGAERAGGL